MDHFRKLVRLIQKFNVLEDMLCNMQEMGFVIASQIDARLSVDGEDEESLASLRNLGTESSLYLLRLLVGM